MDVAAQILRADIAAQEDRRDDLAEFGKCRIGRVLDSRAGEAPQDRRSEEHTSELQSLMRISYAVFCLKKKKHNTIADSNIISYKQHNAPRIYLNKYYCE